jgi:riboflavin synthase
MFTGIIHTSGVIEAIDRLEAGARIRLRTTADEPFERGESVAVSGVCLTVLPQVDGSLLCDVSDETMSRTTLGTLGIGARVNIERAAMVGDRLGGHLVQGHVDAVATLVSVTTAGEFSMYRWNFPGEFSELVVSKGSVAVDGVSLTIVEPEDSTFAAALIPETLRRTTLGSARVGDRMNLEFDIIAKYVRGMIGTYRAGKTGR